MSITINVVLSASQAALGTKFNTLIDGGAANGDNTPTACEICLADDALGHTQTATYTYTGTLYGVRHRVTIRPREDLAFWPIGDSGHNDTKLWVHSITVVGADGGDLIADYTANPYPLDGSGQALTVFFSKTGSNYPAPANTFTLTNPSSSSVTSYPHKEYRHFVQGEITNYPQVTLGGTPLTTQVEVRTRWPDGSVKGADCSFVVPTFAANQTLTFGFQNQVSSNSGTPGVTPTDLLAMTFGSDASLDAGFTLVGISGSSGTREVTLRSIITRALTTPANSIAKYWNSGAICTSILFADRTATLTDDFGWGGKTNFHPEFMVTWFVGGFVKVEVWLNNNYVSSTASKSMIAADFDSTFWIGTARRTLIAETGTHWNSSKRRRFYDWIGTARPTINANKNTPYLVSTKCIPALNTAALGLDISHPIDTEILDYSYNNDWVPANKGISTPIGYAATAGNYLKDLTQPGGGIQIGPLTKWGTLYLGSYDPRLLQQVIGNGDLSGELPMHFIERDTAAGSFGHFDAAGTIDTFLRVFSVNARPLENVSDLNKLDQAEASGTADEIKLAGPQEGNGFSSYGTWIDFSHCPEAWFVAYAMTGDMWLWEEGMMWGAYAIGSTFSSRRGGALGFLNTTQQSRAVAWMLRTLTYAAQEAITGSAESDYFIDKLTNTVAANEARYELASSYPSRTAAIAWGSSVLAGDGGAASPLGFPERITGYPAPYPDPTTGPNIYYAMSVFQMSFLLYSHSQLHRCGILASGNAKMCQFLGKPFVNFALNPLLSPHWLEDYTIACSKPDGTFYAGWASYITDPTLPKPTGFDPTESGDADQHNIFLAQGAIGNLADTGLLIDGTLDPMDAWAVMRDQIPNIRFMWTEQPKSPGVSRPSNKNDIVPLARLMGLTTSAPIPAPPTVPESGGGGTAPTIGSIVVTPPEPVYVSSAVAYSVTVVDPDSLITGCTAAVFSADGTTLISSAAATRSGSVYSRNWSYPPDPVTYVWKFTFTITGMANVVKTITITTHVVGSTSDIGPWIARTSDPLGPWVSRSIVAPALPPVVSTITVTPGDVDMGTSGVQVTAGTMVTFNAAATDPDDLALSWQWKRTLNGGASTNLGLGAGNSASQGFNVPSSPIGSVYVFSIVYTNSAALSASMSITVTVVAASTSTGGPIVIIQQPATNFEGSTDQIALCNLALSAIGARSTISALNEGSNEANILSLHYQPALDRLLRAAPWNFARKQRALALLKDANSNSTTPPPSPWVYSYAYPQDCVMVRFLMPAYQAGSAGAQLASVPQWYGPPIQFVEGIDDDEMGNDAKIVLTNQPQAVAIYTRRVSNTQLFDPTFREAFYNYLGARISIAVNGDKGLAQQALQIATAYTLQAKAENGNEGVTIIGSTPDWIRVRGVESDFAYPDGGMLSGPAQLSILD